MKSHNPNRVEEGEWVILDEDMITAQEVLILHITKHQLFSHIKDRTGQEWTVMTRRLNKKTPLNSLQHTENQQQDGTTHI